METLVRGKSDRLERTPESTGWTTVLKLASSTKSILSKSVKTRLFDLINTSFVGMFQEKKSPENETITFWMICFRTFLWGGFTGIVFCFLKKWLKNLESHISLQCFIHCVRSNCAWRLKLTACLCASKGVFKLLEACTNSSDTVIVVSVALNQKYSQHVPLQPAFASHTEIIRLHPPNLCYWLMHSLQW